MLSAHAQSDCYTGVIIQCCLHRLLQVSKGTILIQCSHCSVVLLGVTIQCMVCLAVIGVQGFNAVLFAHAEQHVLFSV